MPPIRYLEQTMKRTHHLPCSKVGRTRSVIVVKRRVANLIHQSIPVEPAKLK